MKHARSERGYTDRKFEPDPDDVIHDYRAEDGLESAAIRRHHGEIIR